LYDNRVYQDLSSAVSPIIVFALRVVDMLSSAAVVSATLDLHGQTHPVTVEVTRKDGLYRGSATLKQTASGITPVAIAGGTVRVKDDLKIEFEIALAR